MRENHENTIIHKNVHIKAVVSCTQTLLIYSSKNLDKKRGIPPWQSDCIIDSQGLTARI